MAVYEPPGTGAALRQGEILTGLIEARLAPDSHRRTDIPPQVVTVVHPFAIVLSQDCDLDLDYRARTGADVRPDKELPSVLFCQVVDALALRGNVDARVWERVRINKDERYQFLEGAPQESDMVGDGLPELGIDFKKYFAIPTTEVYVQIEIGKARRRTRLKSPYMEHLASRFSNFFSRIALPEDHKSQ